MTNKNHFCIYCGAKLDFNQKFALNVEKRFKGIIGMLKKSNPDIMMLLML